MRLLSQLRRGFEHGVHPAHLKEQTADLPIQRVPFVKDYVMPLGQHIGVPSEAVVTAGERVRRGQLIAKPGGFVSTALHSPVTGTVTKVGDFRAMLCSRSASLWFDSGSVVLLKWTSPAASRVARSTTGRVMRPRLTPLAFIAEISLSAASRLKTKRTATSTAIGTITAKMNGIE